MCSWHKPGRSANRQPSDSTSRCAWLCITMCPGHGPLTSACCTVVAAVLHVRAAHEKQRCGPDKAARSVRKQVASRAR